MGVPGSGAAGQLDARADRPQARASRGGVLRVKDAGHISAGATAPVSEEGGAIAPRRTRQAASRPAVEIAHLRKTYGGLVAVDDVSFSVAEGEIFGILGPNGAGKTTTVECAIGLRSPDSGTIRLLGLDPQTDRDEVHQVVGVQLQASAQPDKLRVGEILDMYRSFYSEPADVTELTEALGLTSKRNDYYRSLSGGQRQRLSVAPAPIGRPKLAVLDEMTTALGRQIEAEPDENEPNWTPPQRGGPACHGQCGDGGSTPMSG